MSSTFSHLQKPRCQHDSGNEGGKWLRQKTTVLHNNCKISVTKIASHQKYAVENIKSLDEKFINSEKCAWIGLLKIVVYLDYSVNIHTLYII